MEFWVVVIVGLVGFLWLSNRPFRLRNEGYDRFEKILRDWMRRLAHGSQVAIVHQGRKAEIRIQKNDSKLGVFLRFWIKEACFENISLSELKKVLEARGYECELWASRGDRKTGVLEIDVPMIRGGGTY